MALIERHRISIAGIRIEFESRLESFPFRLPKHYSEFETEEPGCDLRVSVNALDESDNGSNHYVYKCSTFAVGLSGSRTIIEGYHPVYSRLVSKAEADEDFLEYDLRFNEGFLDWLSDHHAKSRDGVLALSYPMDQVMFLPVLARREAFLVHACAAVLDGKAWVFAGHSGDGKTTLSRILAAEGLEMLSDERVAVRKVNGSFMAYGTPWPGEGDVVSSAAHPLGGLFLLEKAPEHRLERGKSSTRVAELLSRCIVPYYLPRETSHIVDVLTEAADSVPMGVLEFSPSAGLASVLSRAARVGAGLSSVRAVLVG
jgi:hypothetical protein